MPQQRRKSLTLPLVALFPHVCKSKTDWQSVVRKLLPLFVFMPLYGSTVLGQTGATNWVNRLIQREAETDGLNPAVVTAVSLQPHGTLLAAAGDDHVICVWDRVTGQSVQRLDGHVDWVRTIAYSPDGRILASAGNDRRIIFWDAATGQKLRVFAELQHAIAMIMFSHNGRMLATTGFEDKLRIYDTAGGKVVWELDCPCRDMRAMAFSPDDKTLAAGGRNGKISLWNTDDGRKFHTYIAHRQRIRGVAFSPDGQWLVSSGEDRQIRVQPLLAGNEPFLLSTGSAKVLSLIYYAPGKLATGGSDNSVRLWDLVRRSEIGKLEGHAGSIAALDCRDGVLVSGSYDTTIQVWTVGGENERHNRDLRLNLEAAKPVRLE